MDNIIRYQSLTQNSIFIWAEHTVLDTTVNVFSTD
jgi:hypothetical protein